MLEEELGDIKEDLNNEKSEREALEADINVFRSSSEAVETYKQINQRQLEEIGEIIKEKEALE